VLFCSVFFAVSQFYFFYYYFKDAKEEEEVFNRLDQEKGMESCVAARPADPRRRWNTGDMDEKTLTEAIKRIQDPLLQDALHVVLAAYKKDRFTTPNQTRHRHSHSTRSTVKLSPLGSVVVDLTTTPPALTTTPPTPSLSKKTKVKDMIPLEEDSFRFMKDGVTLRANGATCIITTLARSLVWENLP
jgi:hypothetical protein